MQLKEYQQGAIADFRQWIDAIRATQAESDESSRVLGERGLPVPDAVLDFPQKAWESMADAGIVPRGVSYVARHDGAGRPIPHICLKVPTGGGKTLLGVAAIEAMEVSTGLVLWIVPSRAIFDQTKATFWTRDHPYRKRLDRATGGRVKVFVQGDSLTPDDIQNHLCVMLLSLAATNWYEKQEGLRMFRDAGAYHRFFPETQGSRSDELRLKIDPDLATDPASGRITHSLHNVIKMCRPIVVLDEAHKAYGSKKRGPEEFVNSVNRMNPRTVVELSATPQRSVSNILVEIDGPQLKREEMIKVPVEITAEQGEDWHLTLARAHKQLEALDIQAHELLQDAGRYIRPIVVVRVDRTGKNQRDGKLVHALDVRDQLLKMGIDERAVRIKASGIDELGREDLMSPMSPVTWIITKDALKEGWDCSFAYILVMLDSTTAPTALTQMIGRVLRQPNAELTKQPALDRCYVFCSNTAVGEAVRKIRSGLEREGMSGLMGEVVLSSGKLVPLTVKRRDMFADLDLFLPKVLHKADHSTADEFEELDYLKHIIPEINWKSLEAPLLSPRLKHNSHVTKAEVDVGGMNPRYEARTIDEEDGTVSISWFVRRLSSAISNPWHAAELVQKSLMRLLNAGESDEDIYAMRVEHLADMRQNLIGQVERKAERVFQDKVATGLIRFTLETGMPAHRIWKEPREIETTEGDRGLEVRPGVPVGKSLFEPVLESEFDSIPERAIACYFDEHEALSWWHRIAARQGGDYYLRGWKEKRIWPDFVATVKSGGGDPVLMAVESKGEHLRDSVDTRYKERVMEALEAAYNNGQMVVPLGPSHAKFDIVFSVQELAQSLAKVETISGT